MKIHLTGAYEWRQRFLGYGEAAHHSYETFKAAGLDVTCKDPNDPNPIVDADIEISFNYGKDYTFFCDRSYKIGYSAWESTEFPADWIEGMKKCDELWVTSDWMKEQLQKHLPDKEIFVYTHGLDPDWKPKKRKLTGRRPFTFLHIGEPATRKDGQLAVDSFVKLFGNNPDYRLIMKCTHINSTAVKDPIHGNWVTPSTAYENIQMYENIFDEKQMVALYNSCDVFLYPSWGEGFGFNPLQAIAMGIPVISTAEWAMYKEYITLPISSEYVRSPWQDIHPGDMLKPNAKEIELAMKYAANSYDIVAEKAWRNAFAVHEKFDWDVVSKPAIERLKNIYNSRL